MECSGLIEIGVWLDDALSRVNLDYINSCKNCNINSVAIMINKSNTTEKDAPWELRYKPEAFVNAIKLFLANDIDVTLTSWPRPSKKQLDQLFQDIQTIMKLSGAKNIEVDTEGNWNDSFLEGFKDMQEASEYLGAGMQQLVSASGGKTSLTTFTYHAENGPKALLGKYMNVLYPQAYSVSDRDKKGVEWSSSLGPGNMQKLTIARASKVPFFSGEIACGLAAYSQKWPNKTEQQAMQEALDAALHLGIRRIRFWSSKWIVGSAKTDYGYSFLKSLR